MAICSEEDSQIKLKACIISESNEIVQLLIHLCSLHFFINIRDIDYSHESVSMKSHRLLCFLFNDSAFRREST